MIEPSQGLCADDIIITDELDRRPSRAPDYEAENHALSDLGESIAVNPDGVLQVLVEAAMRLTGAGSAGVSLLEPGGAHGIFRWVATAGAWAPYCGGTMPRDESPCGEVIARNQLLLLREPHRVFPTLLQGDPPIAEGLLAPFEIDGAPVGTVWVIKHNPDGRFDREDARLLQSLARFASAAVHAATAREAAEAQRDMEAADRARVEAELRENEQRLATELSGSRSLQRLSTRLIPEQTPAALYEQILDTAQELMRADAVSIQLLEDNGQRLRRVATRNLHPDSTEYWTWVDATHASTCGQALARNERVVIEDVEASPELAGTGDLEAFRASGTRAVQSSPLLTRTGRPIGMISTHWLAPRRLAESDFALFDILARQVADLIERSQTEAMLRDSEKRQAFLLKLSDALRPLESADEIEQAAVNLLGEELGASQVFYATIAADGANWSVQHDYTDGLPSGIGDRPFTDFQRNRLVGWQDGRISSVADSETEPGFTAGDRAAYAAFGARAAIGVPLVRAGRFAALLAVNQAEPRDWTQIELFLVRQTAERTWLAIERVRAETALRESEKRLVAAFESVPVGLAVIDTTGMAILNNTEYRRFLPIGIVPSRDPAQVARWQAWNAKEQPLDPEDFPSARALRGETVVPGVEMLYTDDNGHAIWTNVAAAPIHDVDGRVTGTVTAISDIDLVRRSSEKLRESEERFRQFGEASQDVLWIRDAETFQWEYLTPAFETIYGLDREAALRGDNMTGWLELIMPEDRQLAETSLQRVRDGEQVTFEYRVRRPVDGAIRWLRNTDFPIRDASGRVVRIGGIGHDATALKEAEHAVHAAEARQRTLLEGMPQLVWRAADAGRWTWGSPQWEEYTGQREPDSHGWGWLRPLHPDDREKAREAWAEAPAHGALDVEYRVCHAESGSYRWFHTRASPVRDDSGTIVEWLGTSTDVDELRRLQDLQKTLLAELQHRVRNVLAVIRSMMRRSAESQESLSDYVQHLEGRLSALARTQVLLTRAVDARVDLEDLIRDELVAQAAAEDKITLEGPSVAVGPKAAEVLSLAIHELTTNAVKYGALSHTIATLHIEWQVEERNGTPWLMLAWSELGVPMTSSAPRRQGFGSELITRRVPYELKGKGTLEMRPGGIKCRLEFPLRDRASILQTDTGPAGTLG